MCSSDLEPLALPGVPEKEEKAAQQEERGDVHAPEGQEDQHARGRAQHHFLHHSVHPFEAKAASRSAIRGITRTSSAPSSRRWTKRCSSPTATRYSKIGRAHV